MTTSTIFTATSASTGVPVRLVVSDEPGGQIEHRAIRDGHGSFKWIHMPLAGTTVVSAASRTNGSARTRTISIVFHGPRKSWCLVDESNDPTSASRGSQMVEFGTLIGLLDKFECITRLSAPAVEIMRLGAGVIRNFAGTACLDLLSPWALKAKHTYEVTRDDGAMSWFRVLDEDGAIKAQFLDSHDEERQRPVPLQLPRMFTGAEILTLSSQGKLVYDPSIWLHEHDQTPALQAAGV